MEEGVMSQSHYVCKNGLEMPPLVLREGPFTFITISENICVQKYNIILPICESFITTPFRYNCSH